MARSVSSNALPIAHVALRILIVLNWVSGAAILTLLVVMPTTGWTMSALDMSPSPEAHRIVMGLHAIAIIGLIGMTLNYVIRERALAIVDPVRAADQFVAANASHLRMIAWMLLALQ